VKSAGSPSASVITLKPAQESTLLVPLTFITPTKNRVAMVSPALQVSVLRETLNVRANQRLSIPRVYALGGMPIARCFAWIKVGTVYS
jgi:hypothetical protein